jgi:hypothetical protein
MESEFNSAIIATVDDNDGRDNKGRSAVADRRDQYRSIAISINMKWISTDRDRSAQVNAESIAMD